MNHHSNDNITEGRKDGIRRSNINGVERVYDRRDDVYGVHSTFGGRSSGGASVEDGQERQQRE